MCSFIARMIMQQADNSLEAGQEKYRAYFVNTSIYAKWQGDVDAILIEKGYSDCIVAE